MPLELFKGMVARDGIEPPTPAFSGPRSTTELSGLSANFLGAILCAESGVTGEGRRVHQAQRSKNNLTQYSNSESVRKTCGCGLLRKSTIPGSSLAIAPFTELLLGTDPLLPATL